MTSGRFCTNIFEAFAQIVEGTVNFGFRQLYFAPDAHLQHYVHAWLLASLRKIQEFSSSALEPFQLLVEISAAVSNTQLCT